MKEVKKLYRSKKDRMIAGVCGGIAEYLGIDSSIVRLLWVLLCLLNGIGIILYIAAAIIIPEAPEEKPSSKSSTEKTTSPYTITSNRYRTHRTNNNRITFNYHPTTSPINRHHTPQPTTQTYSCNRNHNIPLITNTRSSADTTNNRST